MAVVQISKIQLRRGRKNSESGIPQLSSAEMAWAVDTQELFIGNGSISEGAPYVGNTKVLTEHDNILDLASSYKFGSNVDINFSVFRSLQDKIDEIEVSVIDFGANGDGINDNIEAFSTAFIELFKNPNEKLKKVLVVPNGNYKFNSDLVIPSGVIVRGETKTGVLLNIGSNNISFEGDSPNSILISNISIQRTTGRLILTRLRNSIFDNVIINGEYVLGEAVPQLTQLEGAVEWTNTIFSTTVENILFKECQFINNAVSIKLFGTQIINQLENKIFFDKCLFKRNHVSVYIEAHQDQQNNWRFNDCVFEEIESHAFRSVQGIGTKFESCTFRVCGNGGTDFSSSPIVPIVSFGQRKGNLVLNCSSDRRQASAVIDVDSNFSVTNTSLPISEVENGDKVVLIDRNFASIRSQASPSPIALFSTINKNYVIDYALKLGNNTRQGILQLSVNADNSLVSFTDNYQYSSPRISNTGGETLTNFEFSATLTQNGLGSSNDTVVLSYKNEGGPVGLLTFSISYYSNS